MNWSWAATEEAIAGRRAQVAGLVGARLSSVRYFLLDSTQPDRAGDAQGPRLVDSVAELADPAWRYETFDCADFAVEFTTDSGRVFTCSWDSPGHREGIWLREVPARGSAYAENANVTVWEVSHAGRWDPSIGVEVTDVALHYRRWPGEGYWCSRITVCFADRLVHLVLGDAGDEPSIAPSVPFLVPSADNIAVLFSPELLPDWEADDD